MTRMWMINPELMCRQHLLGEHKELHQLVGAIVKGISIRGHLEKGHIEPQSVASRHAELVREMEHRGYKHCSPLLLISTDVVGHVNIIKSVTDLCNRCDECKALMEKGRGVDVDGI